MQNSKSINIINNSVTKALQKNEAACHSKKKKNEAASQNPKSN
jgi:hypothetical protein